jgi:hypothetical protein
VEIVIQTKEFHMLKHVAQIVDSVLGSSVESRFLKEAAEWDKMSLEAQKQYLKEHPASKRKVTAKLSKTMTEADFNKLADRLFDQFPETSVSVKQRDKIEGEAKKKFDAGELITEEEIMEFIFNKVKGGSEQKLEEKREELAKPDVQETTTNVADSLLKNVRYDDISHIESYDSPEQLLQPISAIIAGHGDGIDQKYLDDLTDDEWEEGGLENEFLAAIDDAMGKNNISEPVVAFAKKLVKSEAWNGKLQKLLDAAEEEMP